MANEITFTYTYFGQKFVLVCDENRELQAKYNLTKLGVDSYEQFKELEGTADLKPIDIKDLPEIRTRVIVDKKPTHVIRGKGLPTRVPAVIRRK